MKHTPTPWRYTGTIDSEHVQKCQLVLQARAINPANIAKIIPCMGMSAEEVEANAARIVACVNACAGLEDPETVIRMMKSVKIDPENTRPFGTALEEFQQAKKQQAELITLVKQMTTYLTKAIEEKAFANTVHPSGAERILNKAIETIEQYEIQKGA